MQSARGSFCVHCVSELQSLIIQWCDLSKNSKLKKIFKFSICKMKMQIDEVTAVKKKKKNSTPI